MPPIILWYVATRKIEEGNRQAIKFRRVYRLSDGREASSGRNEQIGEPVLGEARCFELHDRPLIAETKMKPRVVGKRWQVIQVRR